MHYKGRKSMTRSDPGSGSPRAPTMRRGAMMLAALAGVTALAAASYPFGSAGFDWEAKVSQWEQSIAAKVVGSPTPKTRFFTGDQSSAYDTATNTIFLNVPAAKPTPLQELSAKISWLHERAHAVWHHAGMSDAPSTGFSGYLADVPVPKSDSIEERFTESFALIVAIQTQPAAEAGVLRTLLKERAQKREGELQLTNAGKTVVDVALDANWSLVRRIPDGQVRDVAADVAVKAWAHDFKIAAKRYDGPWPAQLSLKPGAVSYSSAPESLASIKHSLSAAPNMDSTYQSPAAASPRAGG